MFGWKGRQVAASLSLGATIALLAPAIMAVEVDDFAGHSTGDLAQLCSANEDSPYHREALQFCYGFFAGVIQFHHNLTSGETFDSIACPDGMKTRQDMVAAFLAWAERNQDMMGTPAIEGVMRSAEEAYPCPQG
jgi:hypothetical protein